MKRFRYFFVFLVIVLVSCKSESFRTPSGDDPYLIVTHLKEDALTFIDFKSQEVLDLIDVPFPIANIVPIGEKQFIAASRGEENLILFDLKEGKRKPFIRVDKGTQALFFEETSGQLYASNVERDEVLQIDVATEKIVARFRVGSFPTEMLTINDVLYVLNVESDDVTMIKDGVTRSFSVIERPSGIFFDGTYIWIGGHGRYSQLNRHIFAYDPVTLKEIIALDVGLMPIAFYGEKDEPDFYVVCHGDHMLYKIDKATYDVVDKIKVGQNPNFVTGNADYLFVSNFDDHSLSIIDKRTFSLVSELSVPSGPYAIVVQEESK